MNPRTAIDSVRAVMLLPWLGGGLAAQDAEPPPAAPAAERAVAPPAAPDPQLVALLAKTLAAKSYSFHYQSETSGGEAAGGRERSNREAEAAGRAVKCEGAWQQGSPARLVLGGLHGFRIDDQLVTRKGDSAQTSWELFDESIAMSQMTSRRGRSGDSGEGATGGAETGGGAPTGGGAVGGRAGGASGGAMVAGGIAPTGAMQARNLLTLAAVRVPHELLARLPTGVAEVTRREVEGKVVLAAVTTPELAEFLAGGDRATRYAAQQGRRGGGARLTGTIELTFAADGRLESFRVETIVHHERRGDQKRSLRYEFSAYETTEYEVPKAVLDLLAT